MASSSINYVSGNRVARLGKGREGWFLPLLALPLMMKVLGKEVTISGGGHNKIDYMDKNFSSVCSSKQHRGY